MMCHMRVSLFPSFSLPLSWDCVASYWLHVVRFHCCCCNKRVSNKTLDMHSMCCGMQGPVAGGGRPIKQFLINLKRKMQKKKKLNKKNKRK